MTSAEQFVGLGPQRYRVDRPWGKLPPSLSYSGIADVTVMSSGKVAVLLRSDPAVLIFDPDGSLADQWSMPDIVAGHYIRASASGRLLLSDFDGHRIFVLNEDGRCERVLGERDRPRFGEPFNHPADAAEAPDGEIFVADGYGNSCVHRFASDGTWLATWGRPGRGALEFSTPHAVAIDRAGRLLVGDRENNRVQIIDPPGAGWVRSGGCTSRWQSSRPRTAGFLLLIRRPGCRSSRPRASFSAAAGPLARSGMGSASRRTVRSSWPKWRPTC